MPKPNAIDSYLPSATGFYVKRDSSQQGGKGIGSRLARLFRGVGNSSADLSPKKKLVGRTLPPQVAGEYLSKLKLSGTGQILGVKNLSKKDFESIVSHTMPALSLQATGTDNAQRTPGECIIAALVAARVHLTGTVAAADAQERLRNTWLDHGLSKQAARNALEMVKLKSRYQLKPAWFENATAKTAPSPLQVSAAQASKNFNKAIDDILASMEKEPAITRRNDNFYGRLFETHLAEHLNQHPDAEMLRVRDMVASYIAKDFDALDPERAASLCRRVVSRLKDDPVAWQSKVPQLQRFIEHATPDAFRDLLKSQGEFSTSAILRTTVKYILHSPTLKPMIDEANAFYKAVIIPQRNLQELGTGRRTNMHGLLYGYQRGAHPLAATAPDTGIRPMDKYLRPNAEYGVTSHDHQAMHAERAIGIGMSGSANILNYLFRSISDASPEFPTRSAQVATAAWLAHSGGHSFNEAYSVFGYSHNKHMVPLSYSDFSETAPAAKVAVEYAFDRILQAALDLHAAKTQA